MKFNKSLAAGLALAIAISVSGCTNSTVDQAYVDKYTGYYNDYMGVLGNYTVYDTPDLAIEYYNNYEYPGNEGYVESLRSAYGGNRDALQKFIDNLDSDMTTDDEELDKLNSDLVEAGRKRIENINTRLEKLEALPEDVYANEDKDAFIRAVDDATKLDESTNSNYQNILDNMNERLQIDAQNSEK